MLCGPLTMTTLTRFQRIKDIMAAVSVPVMAKARIGHFAEAQILQALGVDMIDESEGAYALVFSTCYKHSTMFYICLVSMSL